MEYFNGMHMDTVRIIIPSKDGLASDVMHMDTVKGIINRYKDGEFCCYAYLHC